MKKENYHTAKQLMDEHIMFEIKIERLENIIPVGLYFLSSQHDEDYFKVDTDLQFINELREKVIKKHKDRLKEIESQLSKLK